MIFTLLTICILAAGWYFYRIQRQQVREETWKQLDVIARLKVDQIEYWRTARLGDGDASMPPPLQPDIERFMSGQNGMHGKELLSWLKSILRRSGYKQASLVDVRGSIRLSTGEGKHLPRIGSDFVRSVVLKRQTILTDFHRAHDGSDVHLDLVVPIFSAAGRALGALFISIDPHVFLFPLIQSWPAVSETAETLLVERMGDEVVNLNELRHGRNAVLSLKQPLSRTELPGVMAVQGRIGRVAGRDYRNVPVLAVLRPVAGTPWFLIAKIDEREVNEQLLRGAVVIIIIVLLAVIVAGAVMVILWRQMQIDSLEERYRAEVRLREERLTAEQAIRASEERYRSTLDGMLEGCQLIGFDWKYLYVNDAAARHGRRRISELLGQTMMDVYPGIEKTDMFGALQQCMTGRETQSIENEFVYPDGSVAWFELRVQPAAEGIFILSNDITARKQAEQQLTMLNTALEQRVQERTVQLEAVNRELEGFSYSVSHDLRAPLRHLTGFVGLLNKHTAGLDKKSRHYLDVISGAAVQMGRLIDDLLSFSRMGRAELMQTRVDLRGVVDEALLEVRVEAHDRPIEWLVQDLPVVTGDPAMLKLVFVNLLSNAVKFTAAREHAKIEVSCRENGDGMLTVCIRDNGAGFDMQYTDKLFKLFQRLHRAEEFPGTGVGLANVRRIIHRHGGKTWATSAPGQGASFYFTLPVRQEGRSV